MSFADFKEAVDLSTYLIESNLLDDQGTHYLVLGSLTSSMILAYSRPFSGNDSRGNSKTPDLGGKALRNLNDEEKHMHKWVLSLRNTLIAHSDSEAIDLKFDVYDLAGRKMLRPIRNRSTKHFTLEHATPFKELSQKMLSYVTEERNRLEDDIIELLSEDDVEDIICFSRDELS